MTLTKAEIVKNLHTHTGFSKERCTGLVERVFELMKEELENGNDVLISGFGKWLVNQKNPRKGRNPQTGEELILDSRKVVTYKCSRKLKEIVNSGW